MTVLIRDRDTGEMRRFETQKEAGAAYGVRHNTVSALLDRYEGCPVEIGLRIGAGSGRGGTEILGYPTIKAAAAALGVSRTAIWKRRKNGTLRTWATAKMAAE